MFFRMQNNSETRNERFHLSTPDTALQYSERTEYAEPFFVVFEHFNQMRMISAHLYLNQSRASEMGRVLSHLFFPFYRVCIRWKIHQSNLSRKCNRKSKEFYSIFMRVKFFTDIQVERGNMPHLRFSLVISPQM